jgi:hypothetical protein
VTGAGSVEQIAKLFRKQMRGLTLEAVAHQLAGMFFAVCDQGNLDPREIYQAQRKNPARRAAKVATVRCEHRAADPAGVDPIEWRPRCRRRTSSPSRLCHYHETKIGKPGSYGRRR